MADPMTLRSQKALMTRYCNALNRLIEEGREAITRPEPSQAYALNHEQRNTLAFEIESACQLLLNTLSTFTSVADSLIDSLSKEQKEQIYTYMDNAHEALETANSLTIKIKAITRRGTEEPNSSTGSYMETLVGPVQASHPRLPAIPIPTFSGKVWEYSNFWTIFSANVHNQPLTNLQKFNYLLDALRGEAREIIRRFPITEENYLAAVEMLKKKYGDNSKLISSLQMRLENAKAEGTSIKGQRRLLEYIIPIVTQLQQLKIHLDGSYLVQKVLGKFTPSIQRHVLSRYPPRTTEDSDWKMQGLLDALDEHITMEERIDEVVDNTATYGTLSNPKRSLKEKGQTSLCMFCQSDEHRAASCSIYPTISDRRIFMQERKLCLNCGKHGHLLAQCLSKGCLNCQGKKHHHTLCPSRTSNKAHSATNDAPTPQKPEHTPSKPKEQASRISASPRAPTQQNKPKPTRAHPVHSTHSQETEENLETVPDTTPESVVLHHSDTGSENHEQVSLLTGCAQVWNTHHTGWREVEILFDTGADRSFISESLAQELGLDASSTSTLTMYTFGNKEPQSAQSNLTTLNIWDAKGHKYSLQLYTAQNLTGASKTARLSQDDVNFITYHGITLSQSVQKNISRPQILLGCDQLWSFLESACPRYTLPSGLQLIPSKLGYLLTGRRTVHADSEGPRYNNANLAVTANTVANFDDELARWDKYWTIDSSGVCEFSGTRDAEREAVNAEVLKFFNDTIEHRADGYYVRLPYKENHEPLPTNRAIALRRLHSVIETLKTRPEVLEGYQNIIKEQLDQGIIEEIPNDQPLNGVLMHYIPHQPVITPHKETTKLRIVFDASSHFKGCPSLNDILHQGPLILPEIYAMLLRFRLAQFVIISDVEKAFLQVRLNEQDRDATRFLWVKDVHKPVTEDNLITLRFTRVTFGLNASPFLLGATIQHHLQSTVNDKLLAQEIQENLYVDNLLLSAESKEEAIRKSLKAREIFAEIGMNLREFLSNDTGLSEKLPAQAYASSTTHKVLGITWDSVQDTLSIQCNMHFTETVTKRIVARQIASIYDPFGWLVPLLTQAKRFQQGLWKHKFTWDEPLPQTLNAMWRDIVQKMHGFQLTFPRNIPIGDDLQLAVFADASTIAMTTCAYILSRSRSTLIMAKCKLPSIKCKSTIPKLEMNAITLACRLARSITQASRARLHNRLRKVHIFSDSQIALSWLNSSPHKTQLGRLVENRLREIHRIVETLQSESITIEFRFVPTLDNPADAGTRGLTKDQLQTHTWWTGPEFLLSPENDWGLPLYPFNLDGSQEENDSTAIVNNTQKTGTNSPSTPVIDCSRFSSLTLAKRTALITLVFLKKLLRPLPQERKKQIMATVPELSLVPDSLEGCRGHSQRVARLFLIRIYQESTLTEKYRKSLDASLCLSQDSNRIWKSRGRLGHSSLTQEGKHPIFITPNTSLADLIIRDAHGPYHQGIEHTMATVRKQYWIPKLRQQVRKLVLKCVKCRKFNALPYPYPDSTDLPQRRVLRSRPFQHIGLDFFDLPRVAKEGDETNPCGCIFTCTVTRLIHLELVPSMSTEDFLNALRRFMARRGIPDTITCDNAPTFLLAEKILTDETRERPKGNERTTLHPDAKSILEKHEIQWKHITPYAPWQGGFYERLIKSVKHALYKALTATRCRSADHLRTILTEIESCLNSRPLTYQSATQEEFSSIRPIDFIQRDLEITLPLENAILRNNDDTEYSTPEEQRALQSRKETVEALRSSCQATEKFWKIWHDQYLTSLRETHTTNISNKRHGQTTPSIGDIVLVSDPVLPRSSWKMARITDTRQGSDGKIREVELITSTRRKIRRPVNLLIPLEIQEQKDQPPEKVSPTKNTNVPSPSNAKQPHHYNLRPRTNTQPSTPAISAVRIGTTRRWFLFHLMLLSLLTLSRASPQPKHTHFNNATIEPSTLNRIFEMDADERFQKSEPLKIGDFKKSTRNPTLRAHLTMIEWNTGNHVRYKSPCQANA